MLFKYNMFVGDIKLFQTKFRKAMSKILLYVL